MLKHKLKYFWFVIILIGFTSLFLYLRLSNPMKIQKNIYSQWANQFIVENANTAFIKTAEKGSDDIVLSEGQGYGMLIATKAAKHHLASQKDFDKLYRYYLDNRIDGTELMSWRQSVTNGTTVKTDNNNATDGDLYIAYALLEASNIWNNKSEEYQEQAKAILADILRYNYNSNLQILTVGNWANGDSHYFNLLRTSDIMPKQFEDFAKVTGDNTWLTLKDSMLHKLSQASEQHSSGLIPDFIWIESNTIRAAKAKEVASKNDGDYYYNACRIPYHLAQSQDKTSQNILNKMMTFFNTQDTISAGYHLNGKPLHRYQSMSFIAPIFYAASQNKDYRPLVQQTKSIFLNDFSNEAYYEMALTTMISLDTLSSK